eukprot:scaffold1754_cov84-Isochrysis_galbana.AAC.1
MAGTEGHGEGWAKGSVGGRAQQSKSDLARRLLHTPLPPHAPKHELREKSCSLPPTPHPPHPPKRLGWS